MVARMTIKLLAVTLTLHCLFSVSSAQYQPHCASGRDGQVIVHLFSWKWTEIARECEQVLGPKGFCGVQISPPNEHRIVTSPNRPWWERYQPVSYKLESSSGNRQQFIDMVQRCNAAGVRVYVDVVMNHMAGLDAGSGHGSGGSYYNTDNRQFDGVPFGRNDFGTSCSTRSGNIENYNDVNQVRNCNLVALADLNGGSSYVRNKIAGFLNDMLEIGVDGIRIDAAKHMWPGDIVATMGLTRDTVFGGRPFVYQEVIDLYGSEPIKATDYVHIGTVTEFKYGLKMGDIFKYSRTPLTHLRSFGSSWGMLQTDHAFVFVDNHDNQRGHGGAGNIINYKTPGPYKMAVIFMLSWPYGVPRVMSSYDFYEDWTGPPSGPPGEGATCVNGWICEHRWRQIQNMVAWRNSAGSAGVTNWWSNGNNQIAYGRGSSSFIAFNKQDGQMNVVLNTGLPSGTYCDVISGNKVNGRCTGKVITVDGASKARIEINGQEEDPIVAFHIGSMLDSNNADADVPQATTARPANPPPAGSQRTIVFIRRQTTSGQDLFLRGGCGSSCTIPITYTQKSGSHFQKYISWSQGDLVLDWNGPDRGQGSVGGVPAQGSPMAWTSNNPSSPGYVPENRFGDHYWMWDVSIDCSGLNGGYFEVKGLLDGQWESDVSQGSCSSTFDMLFGNYNLKRNKFQFSSNNHVARCGYINVFDWNSSSCRHIPLN